MYALPLLQAPVWEQQPTELPEEHAAFRTWYWGADGKAPTRPARDWQAVQRVGYTSEQARALAVRWAWETRAQEYERSNLELVKASRGELKGKVDDLLSYQVSCAREAQVLFLEELKKLAAMARSTPALVLDAKDLVKLGTLTEKLIKGLDQATARAVPVSTEPTTDWGALSADELEEARQLFSKVRKAGA